MSSEEDRSGFGRFEYPDGSVYEGDWILQNGVKIREGKGNLIQPYREEYKGEWKNDQMHGKGSYHYTSGSFYDGDWENGKAHGKGVYEFQDGSIYDGEWQNHKMHGFGCFIDRFSNKWEGEFVNGVYQSKIQEQLKIEKIEQQKINDVLLNCMPFFQKFDQKFSVSDKKTFKDNMTPFFTNSDEIGHLYKGILPKFEDKQPQVWRDSIMKFSEDHVNINVLKKIQDSQQLDHQNIFAQQLNNNGQIVEFEKISQKVFLIYKEIIIMFIQHSRKMGNYSSFGRVIYLIQIFIIFKFCLLQQILQQYLIMLSQVTKKSLQNLQYLSFSTKKQKMELTLRTPYKTYFEKFDGFQRIVAKTNEAALIVQNKSPASLHVLPPGNLKVKLTQEVKGTTGDFLHLGGWLVIHSDNSCEINLIDAFEKKDVHPDQFDKSDIPKERDDPAGKYATKLRKQTAKLFTKKAV